MKEISIGSSVLSGPHLCSPPLVVLPHPLFVLSWPSLMLPAPCYAPPSIVCSLPTLTCTPHPLLCSPICCLCSLSPHLCSPPLVVLPYPSFTLSWPSLMLPHLLQCAPHPLFMLPLFVVHSTPFTLGLCSFTLVQPCVPSVCACCCCSCCGWCCTYGCPWATCACSHSFDLVCPWFMLIHLCLHLLMPFLLWLPLHIHILSHWPLVDVCPSLLFVAPYL